MLKLTLFAGLLVASLPVTAQSAGLLRTASIYNQTVVDTPVTQVRSKLTGREKLKRLFRPHPKNLPITQDVRDATGNPNIIVFDNRGGPRQDMFTCTYITYHGKRAMVCD